MKTKLSAKRLTLILSVVYFSSYVTRINFAAVIQEIVTATGFEKSALSLVAVCLSITYGVGQIINGRIGDKIRPENLILTGLIVSTLMNLLFPVASSSIPLMCVLWAINGFAQAMMWPPMVKIMVSAMNEAEYGYAVVRVSWGSSVGTIAVYLTAPLLISLIGWRAVFIASAVVGLAASIFWLFMKRHIPAPEAHEVPAESTATESHFSIPRRAVFPLVFIALAIALQGMLRDGITSWMPSYLAEVIGLENEKSILITVSLAIFSIVTFGLAGSAYKRFFKNEVACAAVIFSIALAAALLLFFLFDRAIAAVIFMSLITGAMHGTNLMLVTHVPKRFKRYGNVSTFSGVINACTYVGSAISTYGIAKLAEHFGWRVTVGAWAIVAALALACCLIAANPWKSFFAESEKL